MDARPSPVRQAGRFSGRLAAEPIVLLLAAYFSNKEPPMSQHNDIRLTDILLALSLLVMVVINAASHLSSI